MFEDDPLWALGSVYPYCPICGVKHGDEHDEDVHVREIRIRLVGFAAAIAALLAAALWSTL